MGRAAHAHELVFPAHAGMSRAATLFKSAATSFPRTRGDEPAPDPA